MEDLLEGLYKNSNSDNIQFSNNSNTRSNTISLYDNNFHNSVNNFYDDNFTKNDNLFQNKNKTLLAFHVSNQSIIEIIDNNDDIININDQIDFSFWFKNKDDNITYSNGINNISEKSTTNKTTMKFENNYEHISFNFNNNNFDKLSHYHFNL